MALDDVDLQLGPTRTGRGRMPETAAAMHAAGTRTLRARPDSFDAMLPQLLKVSMSINTNLSKVLRILEDGFARMGNTVRFQANGQPGLCKLGRVQSALCLSTSQSQRPLTLHASLTVPSLTCKPILLHCPAVCRRSRQRCSAHQACKLCSWRWTKW